MIIIKMIGFDRQQYRHLRAQVSKVLAIFAGFGNHPLALPSAAAGRCVLVFGAEDKARIGTGGTQNPGQHCGSRRFAVRAGHGQSAPPGQQSAQRHRITDRRHAQRRRLGTLAIVGRHRVAMDTRSVDRSMPALGATQRLQAFAAAASEPVSCQPSWPSTSASDRMPAPPAPIRCARRPGPIAADRKLKTTLPGNTDHAAPQKVEKTPVPAG